MNSRRSIGREIGTAFAVLAIYLLTVLAPLHHARASQLDFEALGYTTTQASWVLCTSTGRYGEDRDVLVAKCPATSAGKAEFVLPVLDAAPVRHAAAIAAPRSTMVPAFPPRAATPPSGPRGPPVQV